MNACDHTSVAVLVIRDGQYLLIERATEPYGFAPPAGHIDGDPSPDQAACRELREEVGLVATVQLRVAERRQNARRRGGLWHDWYVYRATGWSGDVRPDPGSAGQALWIDAAGLALMAARTREYLAGRVGGIEWRISPGLEPVWVDWFTDLRVIL